MTPTQKAVEAAAMAICCKAHKLGCAAQQDGSPFTACQAHTYRDDAINALEAALSVDGLALVPCEPTAKMIAAAFPTERERPPPADMKIGAEAIMILEGGRDCGSITGSAVIEAASMCKDYRKLIAAVNDGEERSTPPEGKI